MNATLTKFHDVPHTRTTDRLVDLINQVGAENGVFVEKVHNGWRVTRKGFNLSVVETTLHALIDRLYWVVGMAISDELLELILWKCPAMFVYEMAKDGWDYNEYDNMWTKPGELSVDHSDALQLWVMHQK